MISHMVDRVPTGGPKHGQLCTFHDGLLAREKVGGRHSNDLLLHVIG